MNDSYNLRRFVEAQATSYELARDELMAGQKRTHWMWYIFPQIQGLGSSETARFYAISSLAEAQAYLEHPVLGPRLRECTQLVTQVEGRSIAEIFGYPDHLKFKSCMTLFAECTAKNNNVFLEALHKYFGGELDSQTVARIGKRG